MQLSPQDFTIHHRPSKCDLRIYLKAQRIKAAEPGAYAEVLRELGIRFENAYLQTLDNVVSIIDDDFDTACKATIKAVENEAGIIFQPAFKSAYLQNGVEHTVGGRPDFLVKTDDGYIIRDVKMSRRINAKDHPEIIHQLHLYGWLYEQAFGSPPSALEVFSGKSEIVDVPWDDWQPVLSQINQIIELRSSDDEPYSPVGWTKCSNCGYFKRCWPAAIERKDVAILEGVNQGLARALNEINLCTYPDLLKTYDVDSLATFKQYHGKSTQKVGKRARAILRMANAMNSGVEELIQPLDIPEFPNYVMLDLEGLPPHMDELGKIFLWGMQVFGEEPGEFLAAQSGFGTNGDKESWDAFLAYANAIFDQHGNIPFVHWAPYEKTHINMYLKRYGDTNGTAARVLENLLDLYPIIKSSIALPLPSYSLKVIEQYVGFKRSQDEYGGDWAMAQYIKATELDNENLRGEVMDQVLIYNREDLEATWAVLKWAKSKMVEIE